MQESQEIYNIHAYDLVTFVQEIEKAVKLGFEVDLHGIDNHPRMIGYQFLMRLVKSASNESTVAVGDLGLELQDLSSTVVISEETKEIVEAISKQEPKKRGPKGKAE